MHVCFFCQIKTLNVSENCLHAAWCKKLNTARSDAKGVHFVIAPNIDSTTEHHKLFLQLPNLEVAASE